MPTSPPEPIDWSFHLQWMSQRMVDQDARMKKISAERSNSLGDQMAQSASLQQLLKDLRVDHLGDSPAVALSGGKLAWTSLTGVHVLDVGSGQRLFDHLRRAP